MTNEKPENTAPNAENEGSRILKQKENEMSNPVFDQEKYYEEKILPLVNNLLEECHKNDIPIAVLAVSSNDGKGYKLRGGTNLPGARTPEIIRIAQEAASNKEFRKILSIEFMKFKIMEGIKEGGSAALLKALLEH